jgi:Flp pilus assembly protein TadG
LKYSFSCEGKGIIMVGNRIKKLENAQSMVEFALALPILLLVILGVFAFGHLFFAYSAVVSASREAARYGAAVGLVEGTTVERFRDCASIRDAGVRVSSMAGVSPTNITVRYDKGPNSTVFGSCPIGSVGPDVTLGDRILIDVTIDYKTIVPLVPIPPFPLTATTARTIIREVPVGYAPTAEALCPFTMLDITANNEPSVVGQPVTYTVNVIADDGTFPRNADSIFLLDLESITGCTNLDAPSPTCGPFLYMTPGDKEVEADYGGLMGIPCYEASAGTAIHSVIKADTIVQITGDTPDPSLPNRDVVVTVRVQAAAPGSGIPTGEVDVYDSGGNYACTAALDAAGVGSCTIRTLPNIYGLFYLQAKYNGDDNYNPSPPSVEEPHVVLDPRTPTTAPTETLIPSPTPVVIPSKTPLPAWCPSWSPSAVDFNTQDNALLFGLSNATGNSNIDITSIIITWPDLPTARLTEIRFGTSTTSCETTGNNRNCLWRSTTGLSPTTRTVTDSDPGWTKQAATFPKSSTREMRMVFDHPLPVGNYSVEIRFSNNCVIDTIEAYRP